MKFEKQLKFEEKNPRNFERKTPAIWRKKPWNLKEENEIWKKNDLKIGKKELRKKELKKEIGNECKGIDPSPI